MAQDGAMSSNSANTSDVDAESNAKSLTSKELDSRSIRRVYLITYSQADLVKFPTRRSFADAVLVSFSGVPASIQQWCCSQEEHQSSGGKHYHMAIKFNRNQRWLSSKRYLSKHNVNGISVHFSAVHDNYYSAWKYTTKQDKDALESEGHPDLSNTANCPKTSQATKKRRLRAKRVANYTRDMLEGECGDEDEDNGEESKKRKCLTAFELSEVIVEKNIRSREELLIFAKEQKDEGKKDIAEFIVNRGSKVVADVIDTAWEMESAKERRARREKSRIELLNEAREGSCVEGNCGKTFILNPITKIFTTFSNPASSSFAWVDAEKAECLFLNDFRRSQAIIPWHDLLLLLEGQLVIYLRRRHTMRKIYVSQVTHQFLQLPRIPYVM